MTQSQALDILKTGANVFLTGEPGSGKTHTVNRYIAYLRSCGVEPSITASTGIAATHIGGMTIHSWSGIGIKTFLASHDIAAIASNKQIAKRIKSTKILIIDEISMLPPYALDMVESICRRVRQDPSPFGGIQVIMVGDFFQLPPIIKQQPESRQTSLLGDLSERFAYGSSAWQAAKPIVCYLSEQYRQDDEDFLSLLTAIRANGFSDGHLTHLHKRKIDYTQAPQELPKLYSHNVDVDRVNNEMLAKLAGKPRVFMMTGQGARNLVETLKRGCLSPEQLELKSGAAVMFTKNSPKDSYANGTLGVIQGFDSDTKYPIVLTRDGSRITVEPSDWILEEGGEALARITQFPLRLAWAITVHKSQGMSLDGAVMDLTSVFEYGQGYVALSRVRRLSGLHLLGWNQRAFEVHPDIVLKDNDFKIASESAATDYGALSADELKKMQADFLKYCGGKEGAFVYTPKTPVVMKKKKGDTYHDTLLLWKAGKVVAEIAKERDLTEGTIVSHLEQLKQSGFIESEQFTKLISPALAKEIDVIHQAFAELDTDKLGPVFGHFEGKYSYDDLRLARLVLEK